MPTCTCVGIGRGGSQRRVLGFCILIIQGASVEYGRRKNPGVEGKYGVVWVREGWTGVDDVFGDWAGLMERLSSDCDE